MSSSGARGVADAHTFSDMTDAPSLTLPLHPAPDGAELAWLSARLDHVGGVLASARETLRTVGSTTWRSGAATRFRDLVGLLGDDLERATAQLAEVERTLFALRSAAETAEQVVGAAQAVRP